MSFSFSKAQMTTSFMSQRNSKNIKKSNTQELITQEIMFLGKLREHYKNQSLVEKWSTSQLHQLNDLSQTN